VTPPGPVYRAPHDVYHIVGPSETLWRISKTYDVDMKTLMRVNHLKNPNEIKNGQKLLIPRTLGPRPVIPLYPTRRWSYIVIHHTATEDGNAHSLDNLHHKRGFWNGLGYHFLIDNGTDGKASGQIEVGPRWVKQMDGAHANANGMNQIGIGIALVGNFSETNVSKGQFDSLLFLVKTLQKYYRIPPQNVIRHQDVPGKVTECPGNYFPWGEFKRRL
jgi:N-acetyl-anhydromuramyl-L-alanine amidase AmpD